MKNRGMKSSYWKYILLVIAALAACWYFYPREDLTVDGTQEEKEYDVLQRKGKWEEIVEKDREHPAQSMACQKVVLLAKYRMGWIGGVAVMECLAQSREVLSTPMASLLMSDVYLQLGMVNMAQRAAFESMVKEPDVKKNGRALRRLTETALVTRQYEVAKKYISILENDAKHRRWARSMRKLAEHPELLDADPGYQQLRKKYDETEDDFFL
jgi:hypothetical protein